MPALFKRDNGVYYVTFADAARTPKRKSVSTRETTQRAAEKEAKRLEAEYLSGRFDPWRGARTARHPSSPAAPQTPPAPSASAGTVVGAVAAFLVTRANLSGPTREHYRSICERFAAHVGPALPASSVCTAHVQAFIDATSTKAVTRHSYRRVLRVLCRWMVGEGVLQADPTGAVRLERSPSGHPRFMSAGDVGKLCDAVRAHEASKHVIGGGGLWLIPVVRANVYLGLRAGEVCNLRWEDVDFERRTVTVRCRDGFTTKAGRDRTIPLCEPARAVLRGLERTSAHVFTGFGGGPLGRVHLSHAFKRAARRAGLAEHVNFHGTRHTAASWLMMHGASIEAVRRYLGHSSVTVTQRYAHLSPDVYAAQVEAAFAGLPDAP